MFNKLHNDLPYTHTPYIAKNDGDLLMHDLEQWEDGKGTKMCSFSDLGTTCLLFPVEILIPFFRYGYTL